MDARTRQTIATQMQTAVEAILDHGDQAFLMSLARTDLQYLIEGELCFLGLCWPDIPEVRILMHAVIETVLTYWEQEREG